MSAAGSEVMNITRGMTKIRVRPDSLSCESQKAILAFSSFVRTKQFSGVTEGCDGGCQLNLTWNGCGLLLKVSQEKFQAHVRDEIVEIFDQTVLGEYMNFKLCESLIVISKWGI